MTAAQYTAEGIEQESTELPAALFEAPLNRAAVHQVVIAHLANQRQGNASTKSRGEIKGSTAKPWRQKKTGRARIGDRKSPHHVGGGVAFGPKPRSYTQKINRKLRQTALKSVLSAKAIDDRIRVVSDLVLDTGKTKEVYQVLKAVGVANTETLWLVHEPTATFLRACRNIPRLLIQSVDAVNTYEVIRARQLLIGESAMARLAGQEEG